MTLKVCHILLHFNEKLLHVSCRQCPTMPCFKHCLKKKGKLKLNRFAPTKKKQWRINFKTNYILIIVFFAQKLSNWTYFVDVPQWNIICLVQNMATTFWYINNVPTNLAIILIMCYCTCLRSWPNWSYLVYWSVDPNCLVIQMIIVTSASPIREIMRCVNGLLLHKHFVGA